MAQPQPHQSSHGTGPHSQPHSQSHSPSSPSHPAAPTASSPSASTSARSRNRNLTDNYDYGRIPDYGVGGEFGQQQDYHHQQYHHPGHPYSALPPDGDDQPLGAGILANLPRRNHTISSGTQRGKTKRLPQHFEQPMPAGAAAAATSSSSTTSPPPPPGTLPFQQQQQQQQSAHHTPQLGSAAPLSPTRNSLKEIAGMENEHDEWERAILDERSSAADDLAALPSSNANDPLSSSSAAIRRHQSLNHHLGKSIANRLAAAAAANPMPSRVTPRYSSHSATASTSHHPQHPQHSPHHGVVGSPSSPPTASTPNSYGHTIGHASPSASAIASQLQSAFRASDETQAHPTHTPFAAAALSSEASPVSPSSFSSSAPWNATNRSGTATGAESPSRYAHTFQSSGDLLARASSPASAGNASYHRLNSHHANGGDLMDIHASLQNLDLGSGNAPAAPAPLNTALASRYQAGAPPSDTTPTTSSASKKLPSLITDLDGLARSAAAARGEMEQVGHHSHPRTSGHSRVQSTDGVMPFLDKRPSDGGASGNGPPPVGLADLFGPHTAAPASTWAQKEEIIGRRQDARSNHAMPDASFSPPSHRYDNHHPSPHRFPPVYNSSTPSRGAIPSQWGLGLSPAVERNREQITIALSMALAEQQQKTAMLEAALRASGGFSPQQQYPVGRDPSSYPNSPPAPTLPGMAPEYAAAAHQSPPFRPRHHRGDTSSTPNRSMDAGRFPAGPHFHHNDFVPPPGYPTPPPAANAPAPGPAPAPATATDIPALIAQLNLNPVNFELSPPLSSRFLVIKSFTEDDVHRSIRHGIWASTDKGNQRLDRVYKACQREAAERGEQGAAGVYLFFSVNGSGHFCGMAQMMSPVDFETSSDVWAQEGKWKGTFAVRHIFVKDIPNRELRHIKLPNSPENKSVTQSRDTQELDRQAGMEMLKIMYNYPAKTSLLTDMGFYDEEEKKLRGGGGSVQARQLAAGQAQLQAQTQAAQGQGQGTHAHAYTPPPAAAQAAPVPGMMTGLGVSNMGISPGVPPQVYPPHHHQHHNVPNLPPGAAPPYRLGGSAPPLQYPQGHAPAYGHGQGQGQGHHPRRSGGNGVGVGSGTPPAPAPRSRTSTAGAGGAGSGSVDNPPGAGNGNGSAGPASRARSPLPPNPNTHQARAQSQTQPQPQPQQVA